MGYEWGYNLTLKSYIYIYIWRFPEMGLPQIMHFNRIFHYKPSILGTPIYGNPHIVIFTCINIYQHIILNMNWSKPGTLVKPIFCWEVDFYSPQILDFKGLIHPHK